MKIRYLLATLLLGALPATPAHAGVSITIAPPALITYEQPPCPTEGYLWTPGYWGYNYDAGNYYWVGGVWVPPPRVGFLWTPGYWGYNNGGYGFNEGYWGPTVGFYGGINYGYGYGGYGYGGGRWEGNNFRYNTAITRVNTTVIHNTYVDRNAVRNTTSSRSSFNGRGGVTARPDAAQLAASRGTHIGPTSEQTNNFKQAQTAPTHTAPGTTGPAKTANVTPNGRTADLKRNTTTSPTKATTTRNATTRNATTNPTRSNGRTSGTGTTHSRSTGGNRTQLTRGGTRGGSTARTRGPQVTHQNKAPQPKASGNKNGTKRKNG